MKKVIFIVLCCAWCMAAKAKETTHIRVIIQGYTEKMVGFQFVENASLNMEYPYVENQVMEFDVELDGITMMKINGWVQVCLQPGDSLQVKIDYQGKVYKNVEYTGSPMAVCTGNFFHQLREWRNERRYRLNVPSALVLRKDPGEYYTETLKEWKTESALLEQLKGHLSDELYLYLLSEIEGTLLPNLLIYPYAFADAFHQQPEEILPDGYGEVLDTYKIREDKISLQNQAYVAFLTPYMRYMQSKQEKTMKPDYAPVKDLEKEYGNIVGFYKGQARDVVLYAFFYKAMREKKEFEVIEKLMKDYFKKYNLNKTYKTSLKEMMK